MTPNNHNPKPRIGNSPRSLVAEHRAFDPTTGVQFSAGVMQIKEVNVATMHKRYVSYTKNLKDRTQAYAECFEVVPKDQTSYRWKPVTCDRCLASKPKPRGRMY